MIAPGTLAAFAALAFVVIVVPGPSVLFIVGRALEHGRALGFVSVLGNAGGFLVHAALVATGVGALVAASEAAFVALKVVGGLYLVYLGVQAIRHRHEGTTIESDTHGTVRPRLRRVLLESFAVGVTNPKTLVFMAAVLPQFVSPTAGPAWVQTLVFGVVFAVIAVVSDGAYALLAAAARDRFMASPRWLARTRAAGGAMIASLGVAMLVVRRST